MTGELLKASAERGFKQMMDALEGVTQVQAWAVLPQGGPDYLHTDGSIHGIALHAAGCKLVYGSIAFRGTEIRWRDAADRIEAFEPNWDGAMEFIRASHEYWMASWADVTDFEELRPTNYKEPWSAFRLIDQMNHHDSYHAGQVAILRYAIGESDVPPPSSAEDIRKYCRDSVHW
jgi:hypothetical protein